jgi:hypothetical protein
LNYYLSREKKKPPNPREREVVGNQCFSSTGAIPFYPTSKRRRKLMLKMGVSPNMPLKGQKKSKKWLKEYWVFIGFFWEHNLSLFSF